MEKEHYNYKRINLKKHGGWLVDFSIKKNDKGIEESW